MDFLNIRDINDKEKLVYHNSQVFFKDVVDILSAKEGHTINKKVSKFLEYFYKHISGDLDIKFLTIGEKSIIVIPEGRMVYFRKSKRVRVYLEGGEQHAT